MVEFNTFLTPLPRKPVLSIDLVRPDWTKSAWRDPQKLWLDKNENLDPELSLLTGKIIQSVALDSQNIYPDSAPLYKKLATQIGVQPENLLLTPGSDGAIRVVFETFIEAGDIVIHTLPSFAMYAIYCKMYGAKVVPVPYERKEEKPFLSLESLLKSISENKPRLICLPNPDSPTGTVFSQNEMHRIITAAAQVGSLILIDEAYYPFCQITMVPLISEFPNLIIARTFAKAWGLAGLRIGYTVSSLQLTNYMHKVRPMYEVNTLAIETVYRMLDFEEEMKVSVSRLMEGKSFFLDEMSNLGLKVLHGEGNFLHVQFGAHAPRIHDTLNKTVLYREDFKEPCLAGYSRFSATTKLLFSPIISLIAQALK